MNNIRIYNVKNEASRTLNLCLSFINQAKLLLLILLLVTPHVGFAQIVPASPADSIAVNVGVGNEGGILDDINTNDARFNNTLDFLVLQLRPGAALVPSGTQIKITARGAGATAKQMIIEQSDATGGATSNPITAGFNTATPSDFSFTGTAYETITYTLVGDTSHIRIGLTERVGGRGRIDIDFLELTQTVYTSPASPADSIAVNVGVGNEGGILDGINANDARFNNTLDVLVLQLRPGAALVPSGTQITITARSASNAAKRMIVEQSDATGGATSNPITAGFNTATSSDFSFTGTAYETITYTLVGDASHIRIGLTERVRGAVSVDSLLIDAFAGAMVSTGINKFTSTATAIPGEQATYTILAQNGDMDTLNEDVIVTDTLPTGFTFASASFTVTGAATGPGGATSGALTNNGSATVPEFGGFTMPNGSIINITLVADIPASQAVGSYNNAVTMSSRSALFADVVDDGTATDEDVSIIDLPAPMACTANAFMSQGDSTDINWNTIDLNTSVSVTTADNTTLVLNAIGFNVTDGRIWGYTSHGGGRLIIASQNPDNTFSLVSTNSGVVPYGNYLVGDVSLDGVLYLATSSIDEFIRIDVNPASPTYLQQLPTLTLTGASTPRGFDMTFNMDGKIYYISQAKAADLIQIDPVTGVVVNLGPSGAPAGVQYGAQFSDGNGLHYAYGNSTGEIYRLSLGTDPDTDYDESQTVLFSTLVGGLTENDGARCITSF